MPCFFQEKSTQKKKHMCTQGKPSLFRIKQRNKSLQTFFGVQDSPPLGKKCNVLWLFFLHVWAR